jgi:hypothetical protein
MLEYSDEHDSTEETIYTDMLGAHPGRQPDVGLQTIASERAPDGCGAFRPRKGIGQ